jgi:hypothetical protein
MPLKNINGTEVVYWAASSRNEEKKCESTNIASYWPRHAIRDERANNVGLTAILSDYKKATGRLRLKQAAGGFLSGEIDATRAAI